MKNPSGWTGNASLLVVAAILFSLLPGAQAAGLEHGVAAQPAARAEGAFAPAPANAQPMPQRRLPMSLSPARIVLDRLDAKRIGIEEEEPSPGPGAPLKVGFGRDVPMLGDSARMSSMIGWAEVGGGRIAAVSVTSPGAQGVRLGLRVESLPDAVLLRFYGPGSAPAYEVSGREVREAIARNLASGDDSDEARTYWSPVIDGEEATVEVELPPGGSAEDVRFSIPRISHLFSSPLDTRTLREKIGQSASCNLDATCYTSTWGSESLAVARMIFTVGASSYLCTGTLLADVAISLTPYFLSANHCIDTQTVATSLQTYWFYRSASCNSGTLSPANRTLAGGATLLYANTGTDTSFMRLNSAPPAGVWYAGWATGVAGLGAAVTGLHNPAGDLQKISFGSITGYASCFPAGPGTFSCTSASSASANHLQLVLSQGALEGGSSGSGLWITSGSNRYLVGQLHGGSSTCANPTAPDFYGRFDVAYNAALHQWLSLPGAASQVSPSGTISGTPVYKWNAVSNATHYYIYVNGAGNWYTAGSAGCASGTGICSIAGAALAPGSYTWYVVTYNSSGVGPLSSGMNFTVAAPVPPPAATQISPTGTVTSAPTYTWFAVASASHYVVYLSNGALTVLTAGEAGCGTGIGTCTFAGPPLVSGAYAWYVLTWNSSGAGAWSAGLAFTVASTALPAAATQVSPSGTISGAPTYTWNAVSNASLYFLYVNGDLTWYLPGEAGCGSGTGTCSVAGAALPSGGHTWYVLTYNSNGVGPWSTGMGFTVTP